MSPLAIIQAVIMFFLKNIWQHRITVYKHIFIHITCLSLPCFYFSPLLSLSSSLYSILSFLLSFLSLFLSLIFTLPFSRLLPSSLPLLILSFLISPLFFSPFYHSLPLLFLPLFFLPSLLLRCHSSSPLLSPSSLPPVSRQR